MPDIDPGQAKFAPPGYMLFSTDNERIVDLEPNICFYQRRASGHPSLYCFAIRQAYTCKHIVNLTCRQRAKALT
jgi:hypothetical protein